MADRKTAFVTGASRGIGKQIAICLAKGGFDVAITARTVNPGEAREHSPTAKGSDMSPLPGSLTETASLIDQAGQRALMVPADILDRATLGQAAATALERFGHLDVVVHNARYIGAGHMDRLLDAPITVIENHMNGNFFAPLVLNKIFLPAMIERGKGGRIIDLTSTSAFSDPLNPAGQGGWGISYGATKAALHRVAGILALELRDHGILVFNLDPGYTSTERIAQDMAKFGFEDTGEPAEVVGVVANWLASQDEAVALNGTTVFAQQFCVEHNLLPGYPGPKPLAQSIAPDLASYEVAKRLGLPA